MRSRAGTRRPPRLSGQLRQKRQAQTPSGSRIGWWVPRSADEIADLARIAARNRARSPISLPRRHEPPSDEQDEQVAGGEGAPPLISSGTASAPASETAPRKPPRPLSTRARLLA